jgi:hypothetical protein
LIRFLFLSLIRVRKIFESAAWDGWNAGFVSVYICVELSPAMGRRGWKGQSGKLGCHDHLVDQIRNLEGRTWDDPDQGFGA